METFFDTDLDIMCEYPSTILDLLEKESGRQWTDDIWNAIYSNDSENFDVDMLYDSVMKLEEKENNQV